MAIVQLRKDIERLVLSMTLPLMMTVGVEILKKKFPKMTRTEIRARSMQEYRRRFKIISKFKSGKLTLTRARFKVKKRR